MHHKTHDPEFWRATKPAPATGWRSSPARPVIGITADIEAGTPGPTGNPRPHAACPLTYIRAVADAGALPIVLPPVTSLISEFLRRCDGFVFTGGNDPRTEPFGQPTHSKATLVHPQRQEFETALLDALQPRPTVPVLGVCLGMQMMALHAGGRLNQQMADTVPTAHRHHGDKLHPIKPAIPLFGPGEVTSNHKQAVESAGRLRVAATADDGVIEAVDDPARPFYVGVQWHPERTPFEPLGQALFARLVEAARRTPAQDA